MVDNITIDTLEQWYPKPLNLGDYDALVAMQSDFEQKSIVAATEGIVGLASQYHNCAIKIQNYIYDKEND